MNVIHSDASTAITTTKVARVEYTETIHVKNIISGIQIERRKILCAYGKRRKCKIVVAAIVVEAIRMCDIVIELLTMKRLCEFILQLLSFLLFFLNLIKKVKI